MSENESTTPVVDDLADSLKDHVSLTTTTDDKNETATNLNEPTQAPVSQANATTTTVNTIIPSSSASASVSNTSTDFHLVKWIDFNFEILPILLQNLNGPCPLLAIFNILLLRKRIVLDRKTDAITTQRVLTLLAEHMLETDTAKFSEEERINYEHNVQDALTVLDKLQTGLDVNLKFDSVDKFEYTRECIIFDLLNIRLFHGWVVDPQETQLRKIVETDAPSYNQLVEKMIRQRNSDSEESVRESLLIEQFLDENRSQLTHYGILQLNQTMRDNQFAVFFRNNHFSTIWKNQNQLLVLVSDQGYLDHRSIVFETLTDVDNDSLFTDGYGHIWHKPEPVDSSRDHEIAMAMHNEEERLYQEAQQQQQQPQRGRDEATPPQSKKNRNKGKKPSSDQESKGSCNLS